MYKRLNFLVKLPVKNLYLVKSALFSLNYRFLRIIDFKFTRMFRRFFLHVELNSFNVFKGKPADPGIYWCYAKNQWGEARSNNASLQVACKSELICSIQDEIVLHTLTKAAYRFQQFYGMNFAGNQTQPS